MWRHQTSSPCFSGGRTGWNSFSGGSGVIRRTTCVCFVGNRCTLVRVNEPAACDNVVPSRSESEAHQAERQSPMKNSKLTKDQRPEIRKKAQETKKSREGEVIQSIRTLRSRT